MTLSKLKPGDTVRSKCGAHRATYDPDWSPSKPWATFHNGTACNAFATLAEAKRHLSEVHGAEFEDTP